MSHWSTSPTRLEAIRTSDPKPLMLGTDSTLQALPLHSVSVSLDMLGSQLAEYFNQSPELPGVLVTSQTDTVIGMLSRQQFLEFLLRPKGCELFLNEPLSVIYSYARLQPLTFAIETPVLDAARMALRRPGDLQGEPLLVVTPEGDRLLSAHDLNQAHWQICGIETQVRYERAQAAMLQSHKLAALGQLVDGIAHEIMDPLGFIWGNLSHVDQYCQQLLQLLEAYETAHATACEPEHLTNLKEDIELDYLRQDLPQALTSIKGGAARLKQLAGSLQNFCHIDEVYPHPADLHSLIDSIVLLLKSRLATQIKIVRQYDTLPPVPCFAGQLSQVLMNVLTHCIDDLLSLAARQSVVADLSVSKMAIPPLSLPDSPQIVITTRLKDADVNDPLSQRWIVLTIADNGPGLSASELQDVRDMFSIRQRLERETDLAASYRLITAKHGGKFMVSSPAGHLDASTAGAGTEYEIQLPLYSHVT
ncbi:MAG: HAMP domain-containing sensor histidine kinase [Cyanobacteria bacterium P01_C01_bin.120]